MITMQKTTTDHLSRVLLCERCHSEFVGQWSESQHLQALEDRDIHHAVLLDDAGQFAGYAILKGLQNPNYSVELMRIALDTPGKGLGAVALKTVQAYAFETLGANRLWLDVREHNTRAQRAYEAAGFQKEGLLRQAVRVDGAYQSLYLMAVLREEYLARQAQ